MLAIIVRCAALGAAAALAVAASACQTTPEPTGQPGCCYYLCNGGAHGAFFAPHLDDATCRRTATASCSAAYRDATAGSGLGQAAFVPRAGPDQGAASSAVCEDGAPAWYVQGTTDAGPADGPAADGPAADVLPADLAPGDTANSDAPAADAGSDAAPELGTDGPVGDAAATQ